jgi:hypothetical protein
MAHSALRVGFMGDSGGNRHYLMPEIVGEQNVGSIRNLIHELVPATYPNGQSHQR